MRRNLFFLLLLPATVSCRMLYPEVEDPCTDIPDQYTLPQSAGAESPAEWWSVLDSRELNELIEAALSGNLDLEQYAARLRQAEAVAEQAGSGFVPELSGSGEAGWSKRRTHTPPDTGAVSTETWSLGLAASYEVDLWGRVRSTSNSARLATGASRRDLETAAMTLVGQVADRWLQLIEAQGRINLVRSQIETAGSTLDLLRMRTVKAGAPILDFYQQEQVLRATEALLPPALLQAELLRNELALLSGLPIGAVGPSATSRLPELPPLPETGLPADLLMQRPDVRAQWLRIEAAAWNVAAARADRLPALRLTGSAAYSSDSLSSLFDDWLVNLAAGLAGPILDGGRRRAEVRRTRAVVDERLAAYRQSVLNAVLEVDNAVLAERRLAEQLAATRRQLESAARTLEESRRRYIKGAIDYLPVLTALRTLEQLERGEIAIHRALLSNRVALYRALGGNWTAEAADAVLDTDRRAVPNSSPQEESVPHE